MTSIFKFRRHYFTRINKVECRGNESMTVHHVSGQYEITQLDRGYFEVNGPSLSQYRVSGWMDGLRTIDSM